MNKWIKKSIVLANSPGYLDKLSEIYIMQINPERPIPAHIIFKVKKAFDNKEDINLIKLLIKYAEVFPVKDSYIGFLRKKPEAIEENPLTTERIAKRLYSLGFEGLLRDSAKPKETNRQLGPAFKKYLPKLGYPIVNKSTILANKTETLILSGSDNYLKDFAVNNLGCRLRKGIDLLMKKKGRYLIGEAKFLTTPGGEQSGGFFDAFSMVEEKSGNATRIALIDGYIWLRSDKGIYDTIVKSENNIMSAVLLKDFIKSF